MWDARQQSFPHMLLGPVIGAACWFLCRLIVLYFTSNLIIMRLGRLVYVKLIFQKNYHVACCFSLLSAAIAAATEGGKCIKLPVGFSSLCGTEEGTGVNKASRSLSVRRGWSWFFVFPLMNELVFLLLFSL